MGHWPIESSNLSLSATDGTYDVRRFGRRGQAQHRLDVVGFFVERAPSVYQAKDWLAFSAKDLEAAVELYSGGRQPFRARRFVVAPRAMPGTQRSLRSSPNCTRNTWIWKSIVDAKEQLSNRQHEPLWPRCHVYGDPLSPRMRAVRNPRRRQQITFSLNRGGQQHNEVHVPWSRDSDTRPVDISVPGRYVSVHAFSPATTLGGITPDRVRRKRRSCDGTPSA
jgi:hypothetical protein